MADLKVLETIKTDSEIAKDFRNEFIDAMAPVLELMDRANRYDMLIEFRINVGQYGKHVLAELNIARHF